MVKGLPYIGPHPLHCGLFQPSPSPTAEAIDVRNDRLVSRSRRGRIIRRTGRSCRHKSMVWAYLFGRSKVLLYRIGLLAVLLQWSGWGVSSPWLWYLIGIPVISASLSLSVWHCPSLGQRRSYHLLVFGLHHMWRLVLFLCGGLSHQASQIGLMMIVPVAPPEAVEKQADGAQAVGWQDEDGTLHVKMEGTFIINFKPGDEFEKRTFFHFLRQIRTPESTAKRPFLRQSWLFDWFGVQQGLISRWEGLQKLRHGATESWVLTPQIKSAILDIWVSNFWLSASQVQKRLVAEGHIASLEEISGGNILFRQQY